MGKMKALFVDSWHELRHVKTLVMTAMFIAMGVVLGFFFSIQITDSLRLGFSFIADDGFVVWTGGRRSDGWCDRYFEVYHQADRTV